MHRDRGGCSHVDGASAAELGDGEDSIARSMRIGGQPDPFLAEKQHAVLGEWIDLDWHRAGQIVDANEHQVVFSGPRLQVLRILVVADVLVAIGDHSPAPVPALAPHDVHLGGKEGVGCSHDRTDVEVVLKVFDCNVKSVPAGI